MNGRIHIHYGPQTTTDREKEQLASLTRLERLYLSRRECGACGLPLNRPGCSVEMGEACPEDTRLERRRTCLAEYRPRKRRAKR